MQSEAPMQQPRVHVVDHPLVQHKLTLARKKATSTNTFSRLMGEIATLMAYEVTRDMPTNDVEIRWRG
jgi:uracil phosphoribosyltransferase